MAYKYVLNKNTNQPHQVNEGHFSLTDIVNYEVITKAQYNKLLKGQSIDEPKAKDKE